ncbi:MAG: hypothetical protein HY720_18495 [Planctomycetes bacterium]|nr:hypothetical protein [Planctomycetota bacterium]
MTARDVRTLAALRLRAFASGISARFGAVALFLDLAALLSLLLAVHCLLFDPGGLRVHLGAKEIFAATNYKRPYFVFLGIAFFRIVLTMRLAPPAFVARYRTRFGRLKPRLALLLGTILLLATAAEVGFRMIYEPRQPPSAIFDPNVLDQENKGFKPNIEGVYCGVRIETDQHTFRCREGRPAPPAGARRVLVLGDSIAFGVGLPAGKTFPFVAEERLRERGIPAQFYNAAVPGHRTSTEYEWLVDRGVAVEPDLVVVVWCFNDPLPDPEKWPPLLMNVTARLHLVGYILNRYTAHVARYSPDRIEESMRDGREVWEGCKRHFALIRDVCRSRGVPFVVAIFPVLEYLDDYPFGPAHEALHECLKELGIPYRDWLTLYEGKDERTLWLEPGEGLYPGDHHPNEEGCRIAGEDMAQWLAPYLSANE